MLGIDIPLFEAENICFAPIHHEKDAEIESRWMHDAGYLRLLNLEPALPASPGQLKKRYEAIEKRQEENKDLVYFTIRMRNDERLIGFVQVYRIDWSNGAGVIQLGIGDPSDRLKGYGSEALRLALRYAFGELNLYRLSANIPDYNSIALHVFAKAGFAEEVRRRQAINRDGKRWDLIQMGILFEEWERMQR